MILTLPFVLFVAGLCALLITMVFVRASRLQKNKGHYEHADVLNRMSVIPGFSTFIIALGLLVSPMV